MENLPAILMTGDQSHVGKVARWAKELANCKAAQTSEIEREKELDADCSRLRSQLSAVEE